MLSTLRPITQALKEKTQEQLLMIRASCVCTKIRMIKSKKRARPLLKISALKYDK